MPTKTAVATEDEERRRLLARLAIAMRLVIGFRKV